MYKRNIEGPLCNHFCRGKAVSITYSECVFVSLPIQLAMRICCIICRLWPVWLYYIFPHYLINNHHFRKKIYIYIYIYIY